MNYAWGQHIFDHPNPLTVSYSSFGTFDYCKRKFEFFKFFPRAEREQNFDGEVGKAMHHALQSWLLHGCTPEARDVGYLELCKQYPIEMESDPEAKKSLETCYAALQDIFNKGGALLEYEIATVRCLDGVERPAIELEFEIWIDGLFVDGRPFVFRGFIDAILFNKFTGEYCVVDLKTTGRKNQHVVGLYKFSGQGIPYGIVLQAILGRDVLNFKVMYIHSVLDILEPDTKVISFAKTETDIRDWVTNLYMKCKEIVEYWQRDFFPRTEYGCVDRFGKPCQFLDICENRNRDGIVAYLTANFNISTEEKRNPWVRIVLPFIEEEEKAA